MEYFRVLFLLVFVSGAVFGQNKIDSLTKIANHYKADSNYVNALNILSWDLKYSDPDQGLKYAKTADSVASLIDFKRGKAKALSNIGTMYHLLASYDTARYYYQKSMVLYNETGNKKGVANCLSNIGNGYYYMGIPEKALKYFFKSLNINENISDRTGMGICYVNIGNVNLQLGKFELAIDYYQKALELYKKLNDEVTMSQCLNNIGVCYRLQDNYDEAIKYYKKSLEYRNKLNYKEGIAENMLNIGDLYSHKKQKNTAMTYFLKALEIYKQIDHKKGTTVTLNNIGSVYYETGQYLTAIQYFKESLEIADSIKANDMLKESYFNIANAYAKINDYKNAYLFHEKYSAIKDTILNSEKSKQIAEMQTLYETEKKQKEIELLKKNKEIQNLKLSEQTSKLTKQRTTIISIIVITLLMIFSGVLVFNRYRLKNKSAQAILEKKSMEIEQRLLRSQMNPHFIFNSLNSIQGFISQNNSDEAERYLTKFAKLMRYILENSRKSYVLLSDEVNTLKLNLELERLRYQNKFNFSIELSSEINPDNIAIPPMLAQPFVENAIIHGLANKPDTGEIKISYSVHSDDLIYCVIEDNGLGRKRATEIKEQSGNKTHQSLGIQVTKERMELMMNEVNKKVNFEVTDLVDANGMACGTRVEMLFPYEIQFS